MWLRVLAGCSLLWQRPELCVFAATCGLPGVYVPDSAIDYADDPQDHIKAAGSIISASRWKLCHVEQGNQSPARVRTCAHMRLALTGEPSSAGTDRQVWLA